MCDHRAADKFQSLTIEAHTQSFDLHALLHDVHFPRLRTLALAIHADRPEPTYAPALASFLERTPTLEHAAWRPTDPGPLSPTALPALRSLRADVPTSPGAAGRGILLRRENNNDDGGGGGDAELVALGPVCIVQPTVDAMMRMRRKALCSLDVAAFENLALLVRALRLFPRLRWLRVPAVDYWYGYAPVTSAPIHVVRTFPPPIHPPTHLLCARAFEFRWFGVLMRGILRRASGYSCSLRCLRSRSSVAYRSSAIPYALASMVMMIVHAIS